MATQIPKDLKYTEEHEWVHLSDDGTEATVGITDFAQHELGDIVYVEMPKEGDHMSHMDVFGTIEAVKTVAELFAPVSGEVIEINAQLEDSPTLINESPYEDGWIVRVRVENKAEYDSLLSPDDYKARISEGA